MRDKGAELIIEQLCQRLAAERVKVGLSVEGLSDLTGLSSSTISELENLKTSPNSLTVVKICRALKINPSEVFADVEHV